jgi:hypothetical protein
MLISDDAKAVLARAFPMGANLLIVDASRSRLTARARAAFDEVIAIGYVGVRPGTARIGYELKIDASEYRRWLAKRTRDMSLQFSLTESIDETASPTQGA